MPSRLRPTAPIAADAVLVGDPGRALMLAQELLEEPKMSNHARGLWGYSGQTAAGAALSVQATGMGGPSAAIVLADLAKLGLRRALRIGTCTALGPGLSGGELLTIERAHAWGGGGAGQPVLPDRELAARLRRCLGAGAQAGAVASLDALHGGGRPAPVSLGDVADLQTATLFGHGRELGVALAAVLIVTESAAGERLPDEAVESGAKRAGAAAVQALSNPKVEG
jgi:uridine phosphorylase